MRYILACATVASLILSSGCDERRENMTIVPDRQGHAAYADGIQPVSHSGPQAGVGEMYHTLMPGESLAAVARKYNVDLAWLIKRNDIQDSSKVKPGITQLIVPANATSPAAPQQTAPDALEPQPTVPPKAAAKPAPKAKKH